MALLGKVRGFKPSGSVPYTETGSYQEAPSLQIGDRAGRAEFSFITVVHIKSSAGFRIPFRNRAGPWCAFGGRRRWIYRSVKCPQMRSFSLHLQPVVDRSSPLHAPPPLSTRSANSPVLRDVQKPSPRSRVFDSSESQRPRIFILACGKPSETTLTNGLFHR